MNNQGVFETKSIIEVRRRTTIRHRDKDLLRISPSSSIIVHNPSLIYPEERILREEESTIRNYPSQGYAKKVTLPAEASSTGYGQIRMVEEEDNERGRDDTSPLKKAHCTYILILDDEPSVSELLRLFTEQVSKQEYFRIEVTEAENIEQATQLTKLKNFDIIVTDYNLPDGFGPDFIRGVKERNSHEGKRTPTCVLITGEDPHSEEVRKVSALFKEILKKPVGMMMWSKTLKKLMEEIPTFPASPNSRESLD